jgi:tetratricopeptide (TPR) repeat protein
VPLFVEELTKAVVESGMLTDAGDHYTAAGPAAPLAIPSSLQASLLARLDRLAPVREVAQIGAALGRQFSHELIGAVARMPSAQLDDALAQLVGAELIYRRGAPPDAEYTFKHALVQDAAYSTLLRSRRQQLHGRIAATLEQEFREIAAAQPQLLAHHFTEAGLTERAVEYRLTAGQQAVSHSAMLEAVAQLQNGLSLLSSLPENRWRQQQELDLHVALAPGLMATRNYSAPEVGDTLARARALAEQLDRPEYLLGLLYGQFHYHWFRAEHHLARTVVERIEQLGETRHDRAVLLLGHYLHGHFCYSVGEWVASRALFERCDGLEDRDCRAVYAGLTAQDAYAGMLVFLGMVLAHLGSLDGAQRCLEEALAEARRIDHAYTICFVLAVATWAQWPGKSAETAQRQIQELKAVAAEQGFPLFTSWATVHDGWSSALVGRAREGVDLLTKGLSAVRATAELHCIPWLLIMLADAHAELGQKAEGLNCLAEAEAIIEKTGERMVEAELHRVRGDLLATTLGRATAEESYRRALAVAHRQSAKTLELRAAISLARLWRAEGRVAEARDLLAPVFGWFTEGIGTPVLQEAKALLDELLGADPSAEMGDGVARAPNSSRNGTYDSA